MLILLETPAGYALFKVSDEGKLNKVEDLYTEFQNLKKAQKLVNLQAFEKFDDTTDALKNTASLIAGKLPKKLKKFLKTNIINQEIQDNLAIADKKLASKIVKKLGIECVSSSKIDNLFRGLRLQMSNLITGLSENELKTMSLGLAHGLSRYKLKISSDKVDTMIIQAVSLLEDLDKEINNYMMRLREWYGWHFPELSKIITDNLIYTKTVHAIGIRTKATNTDLSGVLSDDIEKEVKQASEISMGTEINEIDESYIQGLAKQIIDLTDYRSTLEEYLKNRMAAIAPNLTLMLGELVGAKLIMKAGSLINLAKYPASTIQILGAEKALFKAIRAKKNTPKYGLIYQSTVVGHASSKLKGKISRGLAAKCALCIRCDALGESEDAQIGIDCKTYIDNRLRYLENSEGDGQKTDKPQKKPLTSQPSGNLKTYNTGSDVTTEAQGFRSTFKKAGQLQDTPADLKRKTPQEPEETQVQVATTTKQKVKKSE